MNSIMGAATAAVGASLLYVAGLALGGGTATEARAGIQPVAATKSFQGARRGGGYAGFEISDADRDARLSPDYNQCMDRAQNNADMRQCSATEFRRLEPLMQASFDTAVGRISNPAARERLRADQRAWQAGRRAHCERELRESGEEGGSMGLLVLDSCALGEMIRRTIWLEQR